MKPTIVRTFLRLVLFNLLFCGVFLALFALGTSPGWGALTVLGLAGFFPGLAQFVWVAPMLVMNNRRSRRATRDSNWAVLNELSAARSGVLLAATFTVLMNGVGFWSIDSKMWFGPRGAVVEGKAR